MAAEAAAQAPASAQVVANTFVQKYYHTLHQSPGLVHRFYRDISKLGRPEEDGSMSITTTVQAINDKILSLNYGDFRTEIKYVDSQELFNGGLNVLVTGNLIGKDNAVRNFAQSFFLAPQDKGYFVLNDMFRYANNVVPIAPEPNSAPIQENQISKESTPSVEEDIAGEVDNPHENKNMSIAEEVPIKEVVDEVHDESQLVVELSVKHEEVPKKSYASIVNENATSFSPPWAAITLKIPPKNVGSVSNAESADNGNSQEGQVNAVYLSKLVLNAPDAMLKEIAKILATMKTDGNQVRSNKETGEMLEYKSEGGESNLTVADTYDGRLVLIVLTYHYLFVLDLKGENVDGRCKPVILKQINLSKEGYRLDMGLFKLEEKSVYMFGGHRDVYSESKMKFGPKYCKLNLESWSLEPTKDLGRTRVYKGKPWVQKVDNKILVVERRSRRSHISQSFLEYYDLTSKTWKEFIKIPFQKNWSKENELFIRSGEHYGVILVGYKMYIRFIGLKNELLFCLNTRTGTWEDENAKNMRNSFHMYSACFPKEGTCVSSLVGLDDDKNIILCHINGRIFAYLIDDLGFLLCSQDLTNELCRGVRRSHDDGMFFIDPKRSGRMFMVFVDPQTFDIPSICLRHFELKFKRESPFENVKLVNGPVRIKDPFVNVEIFEDQLCTPTGTIWDGDLSLVNAVLL